MAKREKRWTITNSRRASVQRDRQKQCSKRVFEKAHARCESIKQDANGCNVDHGLRRLHRVFVVFAESAIATEPSEASLHDPGQARDLEGALPSFDDLQLPAIIAHDLTSQLAAFMSSIRDNGANSGKQRT